KIPGAGLATTLPGTATTCRSACGKQPEEVLAAGRAGWVAEVPVSCGFSGWSLILWRFYAGFRVPTRKTGGISRVFACPRPSRRRHREQSRADRGTGHADQDVEGRCRPGDRSPVRRQGDHRGRAQEGGQGADHRLRELRSPQARGAHGSQSQDGRGDSDQGVDRARVSRRQAAEAGGQQEISRKPQDIAVHGLPRWAARRLFKRRLPVLARSYAVLAGAALLLAPPHGTVRVERFFAP